jgi:hypothetical protein
MPDTEYLNSLTSIPVIHQECGQRIGSWVLGDQESYRASREVSAEHIRRCYASKKQKESNP